MEKTSKIYVAGHQGLVGSAIVRKLNSEGYTNIITRTHGELDLIRQEQVETFSRRKSRIMSFWQPLKSPVSGATICIRLSLFTKTLLSKPTSSTHPTFMKLKNFYFWAVPAFIPNFVLSPSKKNFCFQITWNLPMNLTPSPKLPV